MADEEMGRNWARPGQSIGRYYAGLAALVPWAERCFTGWKPSPACWGWHKSQARHNRRTRPRSPRGRTCLENNLGVGQGSAWPPGLAGGPRPGADTLAPPLETEMPDKEDGE